MLVVVVLLILLWLMLVVSVAVPVVVSKCFCVLFVQAGASIRLFRFSRLGVNMRRV